MSGCWIPTQSPKDDGYVQRWSVDRKVYLHRLIYEALVGPIAAGMSLDHLCKERSCCNPEHLEQVTHQENIKRGDTGIHQRLRTHCKRGHTYDEANTYHWSDGDRVNRHCRACTNINQREYTKRRKQNV